MLVSTRIMMGSGGGGAWRETIIYPRVTTNLTQYTHQPAFNLFDAFRQAWSQEVPNNSNLMFTLELGDFQGNLLPVDYTYEPNLVIVGHTPATFEARRGSPIPPTWRFGALPSGVKPKQICLNIKGNLWGTGGCPGVSAMQRSDDYRVDGAAVIDLAGTASYINASTPLILKGNGSLNPGGGGGGGMLAATFTEFGPQAREVYGGRGGGYPTYRLLREVTNYAHPAGTNGTKTSMSNGPYNQGTVYYEGGDGGYSGAAGVTGIITSGGSDNVDMYYSYAGIGAPVFDLGRDGMPGRFPNHAAALAAIDFTEFTGKMANREKSFWSNPANQTSNLFKLFGWRQSGVNGPYVAW